MLVRRARDDEALAWLAPADRWQAFAEAAPRVRAERLPIPVDAVRAAVDAAPATAAALVQLAADWRLRIAAGEADMAALTGAAARDGWLAWFASADADGVARFAGVLATHGFAALYPPETIAALQAEVRLDRLRDAVSAELASERGRRAWGAQIRTNDLPEDRLLRLDEPAVAAVVGASYSPDELARLAHRLSDERTLRQRETALAGKVDPDGGLVSARQGFLVGISFLVCMVGIANAMLMAITERFREIATMKCLGATDGFILTQFLMEAGIQGAAGGAAGMVVGLLLSMAKGGWVYGGHLLAYLPAGELLLAGGCCIVAGLALATLAGRSTPAWLASRMAPMEAMRVE
jgi:hypothetical protein